MKNAVLDLYKDYIIPKTMSVIEKCLKVPRQGCYQLLFHSSITNQKNTECWHPLPLIHISSILHLNNCLCCKEKSICLRQCFMTQTSVICYAVD